MTPSDHSLRLRDVIVQAAIVLLFFFWAIPITALATLLSYEEIKKTLPWLARFISKNDKVQALVQNSLPSVAMITLNALLPFALEGHITFWCFPLALTQRVLYDRAYLFARIPCT